jgi:hypothetical protein
MRMKSMGRTCTRVDGGKGGVDRNPYDQAPNAVLIPKVPQLKIPSHKPSKLVRTKR